MVTRNLLFALAFDVVLSIPAHARAFVVFYFRQIRLSLTGEPIAAAIIEGLKSGASKG